MNENQGMLYAQSRLAQYMITGGIIALLLILAFLLPAGNPKPGWGSYWMVKPLLLVPVSGMAGGAIYYFITSRLSSRITQIPATFLGIMVFLVTVWLGTVLGLNGTYWN